MIHELRLTLSEIGCLEFVGGRYTWAIPLLRATDTDHVVRLDELAWRAWIMATEEDEDGDHPPFPLASPEFAAKLLAFRST